MEWTNQHDVLFSRGVIAFDLLTHKPVSKEPGQCYYLIAESLNAVKYVYFNVDQGAWRGRTKELLKLLASKRNREEKTSGVEVEHSELNDLLLDIYDQYKQIVNEISEASEKVKVAKDQDKLAAEEICACAVERISETCKRNLDKVDHGDQSQKISSNNKGRSSGGGNIAYLWEKTEKYFALCQEEINIRKQELDIAKSLEKASHKQIAQLIENSQQQTNMQMMLITKMIEKMRLFVDIKVLCI